MKPSCLHAWKLLPAAVLVGALLAGCGGSSRNIASGAVRYKGQPVANGTLTLNFEDGKTFPISLTADGTFKVQGVPAGKANVTITTPLNMASMLATMKLRGGKAPEGVTKVLEHVTESDAEKFTKRFVGASVPPKYASAETSGLSWEITSGTNRKEFDLTD